MAITDIQYSLNGGSVQSSGRTSFPITVSVPPGTYSVRTRTTDGQNYSDWSNSMSGTAIAPNPQPIGDKYWGLWDFQVNDNQPNKSAYTSTSEWPFSMGRSADRSRATVINNEGLLVELHLAGGSHPNVPDLIQRCKTITQYTSSLTQDEIPVMHIMDEPNQKGYTYNDMQQVIIEAKNHYNNNSDWNDVNWTFTINNGGIMNTKNGVNDSRGDFRLTPGTCNPDIIQVQTYPFRNVNHPYNTSSYFMMPQNENSNSKSVFMSGLDDYLNDVRAYFPNSKIMIIGQSFYEGDGTHAPNAGTYENPETNRYVKPFDDSPLWFAEYVSLHEDVIGCLFWKRRSSSSSTGWRSETGCDSSNMSAFRSNLEVAYNTFIKA